MKVTNLGDFDKLLRNVLWRPLGSLLCIFLFSCFDQFVDVVDYSVGRSMLSFGERGRGKYCFSQKYWSRILAWEGQTDPRKLQQTIE